MRHYRGSRKDRKEEDAKSAKMGLTKHVFAVLISIFASFA